MKITFSVITEMMTARVSEKMDHLLVSTFRSGNIMKQHKQQHHQHYFTHHMHQEQRLSSNDLQIEGSWMEQYGWRKRMIQIIDLQDCTKNCKKMKTKNDEKGEDKKKVSIDRNRDFLWTISISIRRQTSHDHKSLTAASLKEEKSLYTVRTIHTQMYTRT